VNKKSNHNKITYKYFIVGSQQACCCLLLLRKINVCSKYIQKQKHCVSYVVYGKRKKY